MTDKKQELKIEDLKEGKGEAVKEGDTVVMHYTGWLEDASYIRLKTLTLGFNFNKNLLTRMKMKNARIYCSANNLLTFTNYSGFDPEVNRFGQDSRSQGFDEPIRPFRLLLICPLLPLRPPRAPLRRIPLMPAG